MKNCRGLRLNENLLPFALGYQAVLLITGTVNTNLVARSKTTNEKIQQHLPWHSIYLNLTNWGGIVLPFKAIFQTTGFCQCLIIVSILSTAPTYYLHSVHLCGILLEGGKTAA